MAACNLNPPKINCSEYGEVKDLIYREDKRCPPIESCICRNSSLEAYCPNYEQEKNKCSQESKEVVSTGEIDEQYKPCCPKYECRCKECNQTKTTCPKGYIEKTSFDECCKQTTCECNSCQDDDGNYVSIGESWWKVNKTGCNASYTCKKDNNFKTCYNEPSPDVCNEPPNCESYEIRRVVQYNDSFPDPDGCCTEYECTCKACPSDYIPLPKNISDPYEVTTNYSNHCCPTWKISCNGCIRKDGSVIKVGNVSPTTYDDGCPVTYYCTNRRSGKNPDDCYVVEEISPKKYCANASQHESIHCNSTYQFAAEIVYAPGETDPNPCCSEYECLCKNSSELNEVCSGKSINDEICKQQGRKNISYDTIPSSYGCCMQPSCPCYDEPELDKHCNGSSTVCSFGEHLVKQSKDGECCPEYICNCSACPSDYQRYPNMSVAPYEMYVESEYDRQKCCPKFEIQCNDTSKCPVPTCPDNYKPTKTGLMDPGTNNCCPEYKCACDVCILNNGSAVDLEASWKESVNGCLVTWTCTKERVEPESTKSLLGGCYKHKITRDPRPYCKSAKDFENAICSVYTKVAPFSGDVDPDPCCDDFECVCKSLEQLKTLCPSQVETCPEYKKKAEVGFAHNTSGCCPQYACHCEPDKILEETCEQWDNYTCPHGYERYQVNWELLWLIIVYVLISDKRSISYFWNQMMLLKFLRITV